MPAAESNLTWFRAFVLIHVAQRMAFTLATQAESFATWHKAALTALCVACLAGLVPRLRMTMTRVAAALFGVHVVATLPMTANHAFLELLCLGLLALLDESRDDEGALLGQGLCWITLIFLFYSGFQKLLYGRYFDGQFLAYVTATEDRFAALFRWLMPATEFARLRDLGVARIGSGPYRVEGLVFVVVSNVVYLFEMAAPVLMALRKTRVAATLAAIAFIIAVEAGARELLFGALMINLLLLFLPGSWNKRLFPVFLAMYVYLVAAGLGLVPVFSYHI